MKFQRVQPKTAMGIDLRYAPILLIFALCFYFSYHLVQGKRSIWAYFSNISLIEEKQETVNALELERQSLVERNQRLRVETLDTDFLEERAREQLGYAKDTEIIMVE